MPKGKSKSQKKTKSTKKPSKYCPVCLKPIKGHRCPICRATRSLNPVSGTVTWMKNGKVIVAYRDEINERAMISRRITEKS